MEEDGNHIMNKDRQTTTRHSHIKIAAPLMTKGPHRNRLQNSATAIKSVEPNVRQWATSTNDFAQMYRENTFKKRDI